MTEQATRYWQNWDVGNASKVIDDFWTASLGEATSRKTIAEDVRRSFGPEQPVFEVGCGTGLMARSLIEAGATTESLYAGGDVSKSMLAIARKRLPHIKFVDLDIFDLSPLKRQEAVVCFHVLQHLPHYREAVAQLTALAIRRLYVVTWFNETDADEIEMSRDSDAEPTFHTNIYSLPGFLTNLRSLTAPRNGIVSSRHLADKCYAVSVEFGSAG